MLSKFVFEIWNSIAEPRVQRVIQFGVYLWVAVAGLGVLITHPHAVQYAAGSILTGVFGSFLLVGALAGLVAVLPGIWWLERVGLITLFTSLMMYVVISISLGLSFVGVAFIIAFSFNFIMRWFEIRGAQLAPKKG